MKIFWRAGRPLKFPYLLKLYGRSLKNLQPSVIREIHPDVETFTQLIEICTPAHLDVHLKISPHPTNLRTQVDVHITNKSFNMKPI